MTAVRQQKPETCGQCGEPRHYVNENEYGRWVWCYTCEASTPLPVDRCPHGVVVKHVCGRCPGWQAKAATPSTPALETSPNA